MDSTTATRSWVALNSYGVTPIPVLNGRGVRATTAPPDTGATASFLLLVVNTTSALSPENARTLDQESAGLGVRMTSEFAEKLCTVADVSHPLPPTVA